MAVSLCMLTIGSMHSFSKTWYVDCEVRHAANFEKGSKTEPFTTISKAANIAEPGDTVLVFSGTYRERVAPARGGSSDKPIVYIAAPGSKVIVKGSEVWKPKWEKNVSEYQIYTAKLDSTLLGEYNPFRIPLKRRIKKSLGQVFVDGEPFLEVSDTSDLLRFPGTWMANTKGDSISIHFKPQSKQVEDLLIEISVRERIFAPFKRGLGYITVKGFIFQHCANQFPNGFWASETPQAGALGCRGGHHWIIEDNLIQYAKNIGLDCGSEGRHDADGLNQKQPSNSGFHLIKNNVIIDNGCGGIEGIRSTGTKIIGNRIERNNRLGNTAPECGGIKLHFFVDGLIEGNLIRDNGASGIWLDNVYRNARVTRNVIIANVGAGIFIELGRGPLLVDNNIIAFTLANTSLSGDGVYSHDAGGVTLVHNLIYFNANFGVWSHIATERGTDNKNNDKEWTPIKQSGWRVLNNMLIGNHRGAISFPAEFERADDNLSDYNLITSANSLLTSETHAAGLDQPVFLINTNKGRVNLDFIAEHMKSSLKNNLVASDFLPNIDRWKEFPMLSFSEWQTFTQNDLNSRIPAILRPQLSRHSLELDFLIDQSPSQIKCRRIENVEIDFSGDPISMENPYPGPFQNLKLEVALGDSSQMIEGRGPFNHIKTTHKNLNHFILWPQSNAVYTPNYK